jgi:inositol oxygenase
MQTLAQSEAWESFVRERYETGRATEDFRRFDDASPEIVRQFYRENHRGQTLEFVLDKKADYGQLNRRRMSIREALEWLNTLVDDSDPDTELSQLEHCFQSAEAIRVAGYPRWMVLTGLIHDLGKVLCLMGEPQWAVVGDTFPVGCAFSDKVVFPEYFAANPDSRDHRYTSRNGIYSPGIGLDQVHLAWGHDEYLNMVVRPYLPAEALAMIRYHSFYSWHREGAYAHLTNESDQQKLLAAQAFNPFDLYSKGHERPDVEALWPWYEDLIADYFPGRIAW